MALCVESAELLEHFQWLTAEQSMTFSRTEKNAVAMEIADVLIYLTRLADRLGIDPIAAVAKKIKINTRKYPISISKGSAKNSSESAKST